MWASLTQPYSPALPLSFAAIVLVDRATRPASTLKHLRALNAKRKDASGLSVRAAAQRAVERATWPALHCFAAASCAAVSADDTWLSPGDSYHDIRTLFVRWALSRGNVLTDVRFCCINPKGILGISTTTNFYFHKGGEAQVILAYLEVVEVSALTFRLFFKNTLVSKASTD